MRIPILFGLACALLTAADYRGSVKSGGLAIPGATVTAKQGDRQISTSTDESGNFVFSNMPPGTWEIEVEMMGFATVQQHLEMGDTDTPLNELALKLGANPRPTQSVVTAPAAAVKPAAESSPAATATANSPTQSASVAGANGGRSQGGRQQASGQANTRTGGRGQGQTGAGFQRLEVSQTSQGDGPSGLGAQDAGAGQEMAQGANESFLVNGSLSSGFESPNRMDDAFASMRGGSDGMRGGPDGMRGGSGDDGGSPGGGFGGPSGGSSRGSGGSSGGFSGRGGGGPSSGGFSGRGGSSGGDRSSRGGYSGRGGPSSFGNRSTRGREGFHGGGSFTLRNSAIDSSPYSISGQPILKPSYAQSRFSLNGGGPLRIPKIVNDEKTNVFLSYFGTRARNPYDNISTLPSLLERNGDFSQSIARGPVTIYDPLTGQPFEGNRIPLSRINPASLGILNLFPLPNQPGKVQNFQQISSVPQNSDNFSVRLSRTLTKKDRVSGSFNMQRRSGSNTQLFGFQDTSSGNGISSDITLTHNIVSGMYMTTRLNFSRNTNDMLPYFAYGTDYARQLGIAGTSADPRNFGPPNLSFTNFGGLTDGSPSVNHSQSAGINQGFTRIKGKQTITVGFEYRRMDTNTISDSNARGSYTFSGLSTSGFDSLGFPLANTGFDFADYLLGRPQSSSIRYGSSDVYFRSSAYNAYSQYDVRLLPSLSINAGLRYEYLTPLHEKYGRMANLDIAPGFAGVAVVTPATAGPYTGSFPDGLVNPDRNNFAPRIGIAWKPIKGKQTTVRAGYGMYYNGSVYNAAANKMAQQPPFAKTSSVNSSTGNLLTIQQGFLTVNPQQITNTFAIDRFYQVGYAQTWNFLLQQPLPASLSLELGYLGTKGTHLDTQRLPNRAAPGSPLTSEQRRMIGNATGFTFDSSDSNSVYHALQVRLTRRFRQGVSANLMYTFSKSIDNASTIGGGGAVVVQDDHNFAAERAVSSFNRPHSVNAFFMLSSPSSAGGVSTRNVMLRDWQLTGGITVRSGSPFTAMVLGNRSDAGGSGAVGSGRADATGLPVDASGGFFNLAAFTLPPTNRYGNAARNTITGPMTGSVNMSFGRNIRFKETRRSMDLRMEANNVLNSVNIVGIGSTVNSSSYGLALNASNMRSVSLNLRFRF